VVDLELGHSGKRYRQRRRRVRSASVVMGGVPPIPWRAVKAEEFPAANE